MATSTENQDMLCVNCGQPNSCAVASGKAIAGCWCNSASVSKTALDNIPESEKLKRCLCPACATVKEEIALAR